ncbi:hypothetical protein SMITH_215 [Smithella sp. ME-1]|uniref:Uncharacterized protein n=1 Tax=hydrocarbon metagenome TaxID=938273 RepID=A0A0W8FPE9_9ZZZZ|nr:hypothetical protein SMITH_215 [Smithella sp. ME-1]
MSKNNSDVQMSKDVYAIAKQEAEIEIAKLKQDIQAGRDDGFAIGSIKTNKAHRDFCNFLDALSLYKTHKDKTYKKTGLTWDKFCEAVGYDRRQADRIIAEVTPIFESFSDNLPVLYGVTLNDIRWLGKNKTGQLSGFSEDGTELIFGEDKIPATPEDITAYVNHQRETFKEELAEKESIITANKKVLADKEKLINGYAKDIARLQKDTPKSELTAEEQEAVDLLAQVQKDFMAAISDIKKKIIPHKAPEIALRQYYYLLIVISKMAMEERLALQSAYEAAEEVPWEIDESEIPPPDVLVDNMPLTAGKGMGIKVKAKIEEQKIKKQRK